VGIGVVVGLDAPAPAGVAFEAAPGVVDGAEEVPDEHAVVVSIRTVSRVASLRNAPIRLSFVQTFVR
jgi:hypothetical protein